ncbi:hypothetical protein T3H00_07030 [Pseudomonas fluorescens]|jgi:hypothetical protein|uniref:hypothetical protein n=1 Tax=Pseudomonas fluorescens TaxID=294 RepID=UPI002ACAC196|nr:hypothetical protein [Pseudomonas fluorescens]MDZ5432416.1 hypothetical protein [Pseudomonas fluorescens]
MENEGGTTYDTIKGEALNEPITSRDYALNVQAGDLITFPNGETKKLTRKHWTNNGDGTFTILYHTQNP